MPNSFLKKFSLTIPVCLAGEPLFSRLDCGNGYTNLDKVSGTMGVPGMEAVANRYDLLSERACRANKGGRLNNYMFPIKLMKKASGFLVRNETNNSKQQLYMLSDDFSFIINYLESYMKNSSNVVNDSLLTTMGNILQTYQSDIEAMGYEIIKIMDELKAIAGSPLILNNASGSNFDYVSLYNALD